MSRGRISKRDSGVINPIWVMLGDVKQCLQFVDLRGEPLIFNEAKDYEIILGSLISILLSLPDTSVLERDLEYFSDEHTSHSQWKKTEVQRRKQLALVFVEYYEEVLRFCENDALLNTEAIIRDRIHLFRYNHDQRSAFFPLLSSIDPILSAYNLLSPLYKKLLCLWERDN